MMPENVIKDALHGVNPQKGDEYYVFSGRTKTSKLVGI